MHVLAVSNKENQGFRRYLASCEHFGIEPEVLGMGEPFPAMGTKLVHLQARLRELPETEIVLFSDCWDVVFVRGLNDMENIFLSFDTPCVFSAEPNFRYAKPDMKLQKQRYPAGSEAGLYRFLNSGAWIGRAGYMAKMLDEIDCPPDWDCDQTLFHDWYIDHPDGLMLDHEQKLFATTIFREGFENTDFEVVDGEFRHKPNGTTPFLVHFGGENPACSGKVLDMLPFSLPRLPITRKALWDYHTNVLWLSPMYRLGLKPYPYGKPLQWLLIAIGLVVLLALVALTNS